MNEHLSPNGLTRRSFIKRSVVAAVAVSSMTIFTGLVNAEISPGGYNYTDGCDKVASCHNNNGVYTCAGAIIGGYSGNVIGTCSMTCNSKGEYVSCSNKVLNP